MSTFPSSFISFNDLSDDLLGNVLLYCDFVSAIQFSNSTSKELRERFQNSQTTTLQHVWREIFRRHGFSPIEDDKDQDYIGHCRKRRRLRFNLFQNHKKNKRNCCFNVPNHFFHFCPVLPSEILDDEDLPGAMEDAPPVYYECDSFVLTSCGTSCEMIMLDPFDGSLSVFQDCLSDCVASDEAMLEQALLNDAASAIDQRPQSLKYQGLLKDEQIAGAVVIDESSIYKNHSRDDEYPPSKAQILLSPDDYFSFDIAPYFSRRRPVHLSDEFEVNYVGTEAKPILDNDNRLHGFMVGVGRSVRNIQKEDLVCTELTAWTRKIGESQYDNRMVCRFPWTFNLVDMDARNQRLFVSFLQGDGPFQMKGCSPCHQNQLVAYPFIPWEGDGADGSPPKNYFPDPLFHLECGHPISSFAIDSTGEALIVATVGGTLELWKAHSSSFHCLQVLNLKSCLGESIEVVSKRAIQRAKSRRSSKLSDGVQTPTTNDNKIEIITSSDESTKHRSGQDENDDEYDEITHRLDVLRRQPELTHFQAPVESLYLSKHLPIEQCGFVTLQHVRHEGSSLLLWKANAAGKFEVASIVNLRRSTRRVPRVTYDGSRLIVFGEDHIGAIILIYNIACGEFERFEEEECEVSGGVYNLTSPPMIRFANRIRHAALGGIDSFDSIHMTCNERMIIVNTRTGNLLGSSPFADGLLVIDLEGKV